jgi:hypothetical protein
LLNHSRQLNLVDKPLYGAVAQGIPGPARSIADVACGGWSLGVACREELISPVILWFIFPSALLSFTHVLQRKDANGYYLLFKQEYTYAPDTQKINLKR